MFPAGVGASVSGVQITAHQYTSDNGSEWSTIRGGGGGNYMDTEMGRAQV